MNIRFAQQVQIGTYYVDFLIENNIILEADGVTGHYRKADAIRDSNLMELGNGNYLGVIHIKSQEKDDVKIEILDILEKM